MTPKSHHRVPISASLIIQVLVAFACLFAGMVLPQWYEEFRGVTQLILLVIAGAAAVSAFANVLLGRRISEALARLGMRSRVVIPREGLVYLAIMLLMAVGGLVGHSNMLLLLFGLMAGPWIANGWFVYMALRGVTVVRTAHDRVMAGESVIVELTVRNNKMFMPSYMLDIRDEITAVKGRVGLLGAGIVTVARLPAGSGRTGTYEAVFRQRGQYRLGPLRISSRFPLGIGERAQVFADSCVILIRPNTMRLQTNWHRRLHDQTESTLRHSTRRGVFDDEFHRIREFRAGDNPRSIHWRSTARRSDVMVQEFHQNRESDLFVVLDLTDDRSDDEIEVAVSVAASLCVSRTHTGTAGRSLLAVTGAHSAFVNDLKATRFANEALDALAICAPSPGASLPDAFRQIAEVGGLLRSQGIVISTRPDQCRLTIPDLCTDLVPEAVDIMNRMTILGTSPAELSLLLGQEIDLNSHLLRPGTPAPGPARSVVS